MTSEQREAFQKRAASLMPHGRLYHEWVIKDDRLTLMLWTVIKGKRVEARMPLDDCQVIDQEEGMKAVEAFVTNTKRVYTR